MKYSYEQKCELLDERASLQGFFDILCADEGAAAAYWLEDGKECSYSFGQLKEMAVCCGGRIESLGFGARDEWVGLALETCQNWPVIFWGLVSLREISLGSSTNRTPCSSLARRASMESFFYLNNCSFIRKESDYGKISVLSRSTASKAALFISSA